MVPNGWFLNLCMSGSAIFTRKLVFRFQHPERAGHAAAAGVQQRHRLLRQPLGQLRMRLGFASDLAWQWA